MQVRIKEASPRADGVNCVIPKEVFDFLNLSEKVEYCLHVGQINHRLYIAPSEEDSEYMLLEASIFTKLCLYNNLTLKIKRADEDIFLGPVVGLFINNYTFYNCSEDSAPTYNGRAGVAEHCYCYYFSINDIDWIQKKIKGYTFCFESQKWINGWFPMPDVIYDRAVGFEKEEKPLAKQIRKNFKDDLKIKFINNKDYLGKWETFERLSKYSEVNCYIPKTMEYTNFNDVLIMLKQNDFIFLKASHGSGGRQVIAIEKIDDMYKLVFYSAELKELKLKDIEELRGYIEKYTAGRKFIIQEGIRLLKYKDQVFDMRILIIKDREGKWRTIGNWARIAKSNYTITNYCAGGRCEYYGNIYKHLCTKNSKVHIPSYDEIAQVTIKIASYLEKTFDSFGELGMDIAIDMQGKLWFIEANTKPDKDLVEGVEDFESIPLQNLSIYEYSKYLTGF